MVDLGAARLPRRRHLHVHAHDRPGLRGGRHQGLPVPGSRSSPLPGMVPVGPERRAGHRHAPEHRLPVADGPVVLGFRPPRRADVGGPAPLDRHPALPRRRRCALSRAHVGLGTHPAGRRPRRRFHLRLLPLRPRLRRQDLGPAPALGRPSLVGGADPSGHSGPVVALPGAHRPGGGHDRGDERHVDPAGRPGPTAVGPVRRVRAPGGEGRRRPRRRPEDRRAQPGGVAVVDRRAGGAGQLRPRRPALHGVDRDRRPQLARLRGAAGPRLLVLLRHRQARPVDRAGADLHPVPRAHRHRLRSGDLGRGRRRHDPVATAGRGGGPHRGRDRRGRRCLSVRPSGAPGPGDQGLRYLLDHRPRPAEHRPGRTARVPRHRPRHRCRTQPRWPAGSPAEAGWWRSP